MSKENIALVIVVTTKVGISHVDRKVIALDTIMMARMDISLVRVVIAHVIITMIVRVATLVREVTIEEGINHVEIIKIVGAIIEAVTSKVVIVNILLTITRMQNIV